jgi:hypothetical protein
MHQVPQVHHASAARELAKEPVAQPQQQSKSKKPAGLADAGAELFAQHDVWSAAENYPPSIHYPGAVFGTTRPPPPARRHFFRY